MQKCRFSATAALWLGAVTSVFAENIDRHEEPVIVTATRTAQTADASLASVTVLSRKDIERQQARSIQDLFRGLPGISIANNGGPGKNTSIFMRGAESDQVLVLILPMRYYHHFWFAVKPTSLLFQSNHFEDQNPPSEFHPAIASYRLPLVV